MSGPLRVDLVRFRTFGWRRINYLMTSDRGAFLDHVAIDDVREPEERPLHPLYERGAPAQGLRPPS